MRRDNFSRKQIADIYVRAGGRCEACYAKLKVGEGEVDHKLPCALGGKATLENGQLLCTPCHKPKTKNDIQMTRKADRQRDKETGAYKARQRAKAPIMGSKASGWKKKMDGTVERRN